MFYRIILIIFIVKYIRFEYKCEKIWNLAEAQFAISHNKENTFFKVVWKPCRHCLNTKAGGKSSGCGLWSPFECFWGFVLYTKVPFTEFLEKCTKKYTITQIYQKMPVFNDEIFHFDLMKLFAMKMFQTIYSVWRYKKYNNESSSFHTFTIPIFIGYFPFTWTVF